MQLRALLPRVSERLGIASLTPMQEEMSRCTLPIKAIVIAPTGSGKTLAYALPLLRALKAGKEGVKGLVIVPTRELALQVYEVVRSLANPEIKTTALYGGHSVETEKNSIAGLPDVIVATPGRLLDHIQRGNLSIRGVEVLVLDEYDKSLELGFLDEMRAIVGRIKNAATTILTSATRLTEIPDILGSDTYVLDYSADGYDESNVEFRRVDSHTADKLETLDRLLRDLLPDRTIVFLNHREAVERVYEYLRRSSFPVGMYHGGLEQEERERALIMFSNGTTPVLVSTDLASRGLDVDAVGAVVHYHLPTTLQALIHRNGRTGRMGASGRAFAIISENDKIADFFPAIDIYYPEGTGCVVPSKTATLYFNAGKKEKISKGDIVGFLIQKGGLTKEEVGRIDVKDHSAYAAIQSAKVYDTLTALSSHKIKNMRVRVTRVKN
ncbi:MAG: DEAD/DEAH box helicase [Muribaculaceae bacterium]|nr:DEAD/DEAH box helicase [Muribaculaceae bacterium]